MRTILSVALAVLCVVAISFAVDPAVGKQSFNVACPNDVHSRSAGKVSAKDLFDGRFYACGYCGRMHDIQETELIP